MQGLQTLTKRVQGLGTLTKRVHGLRTLTEGVRLWASMHAGGCCVFLAGRAEWAGVRRIMAQARLQTTVEGLRRRSAAC